MKFTVFRNGSPVLHGEDPAEVLVVDVDDVSLREIPGRKERPFAGPEGVTGRFLPEG